MGVPILPPLRRTARGVQALETPSPASLVHSSKEFKMITSAYDDRSEAIILRGRTMDDKSLQVRLLGFEYYFYLQRQTPFPPGPAGDSEMAQTVAVLEGFCRSRRSFTLPVQGVMDEDEEMAGLYANELENPPAIRCIQRADGVYRTLYGYTPENEYLQGLVRVYVSSYHYAQVLTKAIESEEYLDMLEATYGREHRMALRSYGASIQPDALYMMSYGVTRGGYCQIFDYATDMTRVVYADEYYMTNYRKMRTIEDPKGTVPFRLFSYDIECIGKPDGRGGMTFPVATTNPETRAPADPVMMISCVQNRYGKEKGLLVHKAKTFIYPHPQAREPMQRKAEHARIPRSEFDKLSPEEQQTLSSVYRLMDVEECESEAHLLRAFQDYFHSSYADIVTGWNTNQFDYPFLYNRWVELYETDEEAKKVLGKPRPSFGMAVRQCSYSRWTFTSSKASGARKFQKISLPHVLYADGQVVMENPSYGLPKAPSFKLDLFASHPKFGLKYPNTNRPQRKIKFPLARSMAIWRGGGAGMWFFTCYCFVDALLPLQLLDKFDKVGLMFNIANITYCDTNKVYNNGMQVKCISIIQRASFLYKGGIFLVPDYGKRHFHWPGLFRHANVRAKVKEPEYAEQFRCAPEKETNYPGAKVIVPKAGYYPVPVATDDFKSLYPTSLQNYAISYDTFLTPETIKLYGVRSHEFIRVPLGPKSLTYCGYAVEDPAAAKLAGYTESTIMYSYFYSPRGVTFMGYIIDLLFTLRASFRKVLGGWSRAAFLMQYYGGSRPDFSNLDWKSKQEQKYGESFIRLVEANMQDDVVWRAMLEEAWQEYSGHGIAPRDAVWYGNLQADKMDIAQLAAKLTLNSLYGFTGVVVTKAILPLMVLAAATTAIGRRVLELTKNVAERVDARVVAVMFMQALQESPERQSEMFDDICKAASSQLLSPIGAC